MNYLPERPRPSSQTVLVISNDAEDRAHYSELFTTQGLSTVERGGLAAATDVIASNGADLVVIDEPSYCGATLDFFRQTQAKGGAPVILISSAARVTDQILALELGADDLMSKPLDLRLLMARTRALLRRRNPISPSGACQKVAGAWSLDSTRRELTSPQGRRVVLTASEVRLFDLFSRNRGSVVTMEQIAQCLGLRHDPRNVAVRTAMSRFGRKLRNEAGPPPLRNIRGSGYIYDDKADARAPSVQ